MPREQLKLGKEMQIKLDKTVSDISNGGKVQGTGPVITQKDSQGPGKEYSHQLLIQWIIIGHRDRTVKTSLE